MLVGRAFVAQFAGSSGACGAFMQSHHHSECHKDGLPAWSSTMAVLRVPARAVPASRRPMMQLSFAAALPVDTATHMPMLSSGCGEGAQVHDCRSQNAAPSQCRADGHAPACADPFANDVNFLISMLTLEELGATGNKACCLS